MPSDAPEDSKRDEDVSISTTVRSYVDRRIQWLRSTSQADAEALAILPGGPWSAYGLIGAVVLVFSVLRLGIVDLYTESIVFLVLAITIGLLGWSLGMALVVLHAGFDLLHSIWGLTPKTFVGRLTTYIVLYALVVSIPSTQRVLHARLEQVDDRYPWLDPVAAPASAIGAGVLVYLWAEVAPYLVRAAFEFSPSVVAIATVQNNVRLLTLLTVVIGGGIAVGYQRRVGPMVTVGWDNGLSIPSQFGWLRYGFRYATVFVLVSGILTSALDMIILAIALVAADFLLPKAADRASLSNTILSIPYTLRLVLAFAITFFAARFFMAVRYGPFAGSQFFPLVASLAVGLFVFRLLLNVDEAVTESNESTHSRGGIPPGVFALIVLFGVLITVPDIALAHDCSSLADCESGARAGTAAGISALALALWYWTNGPSGSFDLGTLFSGTEQMSQADAAKQPADDSTSKTEGSRPTQMASGISSDEMGRDDREEESDDDEFSDSEAEIELVDVESGRGDHPDYLVLRNAGDSYLDLSGWSVEDSHGHDYVFPPGIGIEPGNRLRLYTGEGTNTESIHHWGLEHTLWNAGETVLIKNAVGDVEDSATIPVPTDGEDQ